MKKNSVKFFVKTIISVLLTACCIVSLASLTGCSSPTYMTIGGEEVSYDFVRSFVKNHLAAYDEEALTDEATRQKIRDAVLNDIKMAYVIPVVAKEFDIVLDNAAMNTIEKELDYYQSLGDVYDQLLAEQHATEDVFETLLRISALDDAVFDALTDGGMVGDRFVSTNEVIDADLEKGDWYSAEYVILYYDDVNYETRKEALEKARQAIIQGSTFREATAEIKTLYGSEFIFASDGCFTSTIYNEAFDETVQSLKIGDVSEIIKTYSSSDGSACLMLMRRNSLSKSYIDQNYNTVISYYLAREYAAYMKERAEGLDVIIAEKYQDTDLLDIE